MAAQLPGLKRMFNSAGRSGRSRSALSAGDRHQAGQRRADDADHKAKETTTPIATHADPPYKNHSPAVVAVTSTLPSWVPFASRKTRANQPAAGATPPAAARIPQPPSTHVAAMATPKPSAANGA